MISITQEITNPKIDNVQALRGIAALLVFFAHLVGAEKDYGGGQQLLPGFIQMGVTGVDLFFLISGFVMVYVTTGPNNTHKNGHGLQASGRFFVRRAARIYPLYWVLTILLLVLYAGKKILFGEDTPITNYVSSFLLTPSAQFPIIPVGWTLIHEMYFYVMISLFLLLPRKWLGHLLCLWAIAIFLGMIANLHAYSPWLFVMFSPLTYEFITGAFIALWVLRGIRVWPHAALILALISLFFALVPYADNLYPNAVTSHLRRTILFTLPYGLLLYAAVCLEWDHKKVSPKWLIQMGDASYSLYLIHIPVFLVLGKMLSFFAGPGIFDNIVLMIAYLVTGIIAAMLTHRFIEKPLIRMAHKLTS